MVTRASALLVSLGVLAGVGGCALVLGFEDHELFPPGAAGGSAGSAGSAGEGGIGAAGGHGGEAGTAGGAGGAAGGGVAGAAGAGGTPSVDVLLIPDASEDAVGIYDLADGTYRRDLVPPYTGTEPYELITPHSAVQGPDGLIYLSDQVADAVYRFAPDGAFVDLFADSLDGLDNVRGIDFRDDELFVSVSPGSLPPFVARFAADGSRLADFVLDDSDPFDLLFLAPRTMLLANIEDPDDVRLYDVNGSSYDSLVTINFPQQIQPLANGNYVVAGWSEVTEFTVDGTVVRTLTGFSGTSGIYPLASGDWLISSDDGLQVVNPFSQQVVSTPRVGASFMKIERARLPQAVVEGG